MTDDLHGRRLERLGAALDCTVSGLPALDFRTLGSHVRDLKGHIAAVGDAANPAWVDELWSTWAELEYIYAIGLDEGRTTLTVAESETVKEALNRLREQIAESSAGASGVPTRPRAAHSAPA